MYLTISAIFVISTLAMVVASIYLAFKAKRWSLMVMVTFCAIIIPLSYFKMAKRVIHSDSTIPTVASVTNGLYQVLGTYEDAGGYLSIVHRRQIQSVIVEKKLVETIPADPLPTLMRTEFPVTSGTNVLDNYLIEVGIDKGAPFVRDYTPFKYFK